MNAVRPTPVVHHARPARIVLRTLKQPEAFTRDGKAADYFVPKPEIPAEIQNATGDTIRTEARYGCWFFRAADYSGPPGSALGGLDSFARSTR